MTRVFRARALSLLVLALIMVGVAGLWGWGAWVAPSWILQLPLLVAALFFAWIAQVMLAGVMRGFGPGNWVLRLGPGGVALKLRTFLNDDLPTSDPVVVLLRWEEISAVGAVRGQRTLPLELTGASSYEEGVTYLDLHLVHEDTAPLAGQLASERDAPRTGRTHHKHYPVSLAAPDRIRVCWKSGRNRLRPGIDRALQRFERFVTVDPPVELEDQDWRALQGEAFDDLVLRLAEEGQELRAISLLRLRHGWSLTRAKIFVDELLGRSSERVAS